MKSEVLSGFPLTGLTCAGLLIFLFTFIAVLLWAFRRNGKEVYSHLQSLPLREDSSV